MTTAELLVTPAAPSVNLSPEYLAKFWARVCKDGPIPEHCPELGPCWVWLGGKTSAGYGHLYINKVPHYCHRLSWQIHYGEIPAGLFVLHKCDRPSCLHPLHLVTGTVKDNSRDMVSKGRWWKGERIKGDAHYSRTNPEKLARGDRSGPRLHPERMPRGDANGSRKHPEKLMRGEKVFGAKLTAEKVREIRKLHAEGVNMEQLGRMFSVRPSNIDFIVKRKTWRHVTAEVVPDSNCS